MLLRGEQLMNKGTDAVRRRLLLGALTLIGSSATVYAGDASQPPSGRRFCVAPSGSDS